MSDVGALTAELGSGRPRPVVVAYPRGWVEALAARLNADIAAQTGTAPPPVTVAEPAAPGELPAMRGDRFDAPAGTSITISQLAGGIVAVVPPQGARASRGLLIFAILWLTFVGFFAAVMTFAGDTPKRGRGRPQNKFVPAVVIGVFGLIGAGMLAGAVNQMRRKASLRASRDELIILEQSLFGTKTFKRAAREVAAIRVGPSGMVVNNVPVLELQIMDTGGKQQGFFTHLTNDEQHWLATHLRHATGVGEGG